ncbi:MAG: glutamate--tRNA ligase, partial [Thaumarchaeota archaeon]|nr:glutamate--tRNA ligase [Nitrososphaerota archaeon]
MSSSLEESVRKYTLLNAAGHLGRANAQSIISKLLGDMPQLRPQARELVELVRKEVEKVNAMDKRDQNELVKTLLPKIPKSEKKENSMTLPPLPNADHYDKIVTRFSPNPDCVIHFGSTRALLLSHDYARQYKGKFILRFEDTDPRLKKASIEFYELIREDLRWLSCDWDEEAIQSDRIEIYYEYAEKLLLIGKGYVCTCPVERFKNEVVRSKPCPCRDLESEVHMERWHGMLTNLKEGSAVYRIKTDLKHPNPAIRDWPALRIIDVKKFPHPRTDDKYRVWPLYNFASAIDDHLLKISHIIRGKEHQSNMVKQRYLYDYLGWKYPESIHYGRLKMEGVDLSKSRILEGVHSGKYWGFDDPRLATISALRRRGYQPLAIRRIIYDIGFKPVEVTVSWELLNSYNRKVVDHTSPRYSVVISPVELWINGIEGPFTVDLRKHPRDESGEFSSGEGGGKKKEEKETFVKDPDSEDHIPFADNAIETFHSKEQAKKAGGKNPVVDEDTGLYYKDNNEWQKAHGSGSGEVIDIQTYDSKEDAMAAGNNNPVVDEETGLWFSSNTSWQTAHGGANAEEFADDTLHIIKPKRKSVKSAKISIGYFATENHKPKLQTGSLVDEYHTASGDRYVTYFLLNDQTNLKGWGVTAKSIPQNIGTFKNMPFVITKTKFFPRSAYGEITDHPSTEHFKKLGIKVGRDRPRQKNDMMQQASFQEEFRVGNIDEIVRSTNGDWMAFIKIKQQFADYEMPPLVSPAIFQLNPMEPMDNIST